LTVVEFAFSNSMKKREATWKGIGGHPIGIGIGIQGIGE
jgi:hypothetical protein